MVALTLTNQQSGLMNRLWSELPSYWVSVDPGDVHVGVAWWHGPVCIRSYETNPDAMVDTLIDRIANHDLRLVVYERFALRGALMAQQQGSEFLTSQLIGAIRHVCRRANIACVGHRPREHKVILRQPGFKPPKRPLTEWASYGHGGHAKDAETLGEYHVIRITKRGRGY